MVRFIALLLLTLAAWPAYAQSDVKVIGPVTPGNCVQWFSTTQVQDPGVTCNGGAGSSPGGSNGQIQFNNSGAFGGLPATGIDQNTLNSQTSNYSVATTDCSKTIQAGTGSTGQFTVTLPSVSGFASNCSVTILNGDTTNGKLLSGFPAGAPAILWPKQTIGVKIVNGAWDVFYNPGRWKVAGGTLNLFANQSTGADTNDGLTSGTATQHILVDLDNLENSFDFTSYSGFAGEPSGPTKVVITEAAGQCDTNGIHYSPHGGVPGAVGAAAIILSGGSGAGICAVGNDAIAVFNGGLLQVQNLILSSTTGNDIVAGPEGQVYINNGVTFGAAPSGAHMLSSTYGKIFINTAAYTVSASAQNHYAVQNNGIIFTQQSPTITISNNLAMVNWVSVSFGGSNVVVPSETYSLGGNTVTTSGNRVVVNNNGTVYTGAGNTACLNSYFPGNVNGVAASGGQCN